MKNIYISLNSDETECSYGNEQMNKKLWKWIQTNIKINNACRQHWLSRKLLKPIKKNEKRNYKKTKKGSFLFINLDFKFF